MLTRAELEALDWSYDKAGAMVDDSRTDSLVADIFTGGHDERMDGAGLLMAAAPKLALACLDVLSAINFIPLSSTGNLDRSAAQVRSALEAAGVEVPDVP